MQKRKVLSLEWKNEGVMDDKSGEFMELVEDVPLKELTDVKKLTYIGFRAHVKIASRIVSYVNVEQRITG